MAKGHRPLSQLRWVSCIFLENAAKIQRIIIANNFWQLADGEYTMARFQAEQGRYYLLGGNFKTTDGPFAFGNYIWGEFENLPAVERKLVEGPYIHHMSEVAGS